jgi:hypothetical protein
MSGKQIDSKSDKSLSMDAINFFTRGPTNSRDAIMPTPATQRMPIRMSSALLEILRLNGASKATSERCPFSDLLIVPDSSKRRASKKRPRLSEPKLDAAGCVRNSSASPASLDQKLLLS